MNREFRVGLGYDVHALEEGYDLIIGGVNIDFSKGSKGHSDGDALMHSIVDAILGGACLGDIGEYFPSQDKRWKNSSSDTFLKFALNSSSLVGFPFRVHSVIPNSFNASTTVVISIFLLSNLYKCYCCCSRVIVIVCSTTKYSSSIYGCVL